MMDAMIKVDKVAEGDERVDLVTVVAMVWSLML